MKTAVIYARYSSDRQTEQSIEGQLRVCNEFAQKNDIVIVDTYIDRAMTGTNDNRPAFQKMLADSDKPQAWDIVLVYAIDRFGRNSIEIAVNKQRLRKNKKILISATQRTSTNIDGTQNLDGILLENVLVGLAEYYSAELSQKVRRGQNESRQKGNFAGGTLPYGYKCCNKKIVVDESKAEIVNQIFTMYSNGKIVRDIITELTSSGITVKGKPFKHNAIYKMLRNEKYIGIYRYGEEVFANTYPQIVPTDLFEKVQSILLRNKLGSSSKNTVYTLKGKLYCGICGKKMNGESGTSRTGEMKYYYKCSTKKKNNDACHKKSIRQEDIEQSVLEVVNNVLTDEFALDFISDKVMQIHEQRIRNQSVLNILMQERNTAQNALNNVMNAIEQGILTATTKTRLNELECQIEELNVKILAEENKLNDTFDKDDVIDFLRNSAVQSDPQSIVDRLVDKIILDDETMQINFKYTDKTNPDEPIIDRREFLMPIRSNLFSHVLPKHTQVCFFVAVLCFTPPTLFFETVGVR